MLAMWKLQRCQDAYITKVRSSKLKLQVSTLPFGVADEEWER